MKPEQIESIFSLLSNPHVYANSLVNAKDVESVNCLIKSELAKIADTAGLTPLNAACFRQDAKTFLPHFHDFSSEEELENFIEFSRSAAMLNFSYSTNNYYFFPYHYEMFKREIEAAIKPGQLKEVFLDVVDAIQTGNVLSGVESNFKILQAPYQRHSAFFIIDYDKKHGLPYAISYCDGNLPITRSLNPGSNFGFGEIRFILDPDKIESLDLENYLKTSLAGENFNQQTFFQTISNIALPSCDGGNIPVQLQKRENCGFKSYNIVARAALARVNPKMIFGYSEESGNFGEGHQQYKEYKEDLFNHNLRVMVRLSSPLRRDHCYYDGVIRTLKDTVFLQAVAKGQTGYVRWLDKVFEREGINVREIKNSEGNNAMFFAKRKGSPRILEWCRDKAIPDMLPDSAIIPSSNEIVTIAASEKDTGVAVGN